jgi:hypothetical protein
VEEIVSSSVHVAFHRSLSIILAALLITPAMPAQTEPAAKAKLNLVIVEGDGAINNVRKRMARAPIVRVEDENHRPIGGAAVTFLLPREGAGATFADGSRSTTVLTDKSGRAVARGMQPNSVPGQYQINVTASYQGATGTAVISQSNALVAAAAAGVGAGISAKMIALIAVAGAAAAGGVAVAATRGGDKPPAAAAVAISPGAPSVGAPR